MTAEKTQTRSFDSLRSDQEQVQLALGTYWWTTLTDLMWLECDTSSSVTRAMMKSVSLPAFPTAMNYSMLACATAGNLHMLPSYEITSRSGLGQYWTEEDEDSKHQGG